MERKEYVPHHSGMPDENYLRMMAREEFAWDHRMQIDPLEGFQEGPIAPKNPPAETAKTTGKP